MKLNYQMKQNHISVRWRFSFIALCFSPLLTAQTPPRDEASFPPPPLYYGRQDESIISRSANARRGLESAQRALEGVEQANRLERLRAEEERRKILWERDQAEWKQKQAAKQQASTQSTELSYQEEEATTAEYQKKANQGIGKYQTALGVRYATGKGCPKDLVLAYMWFNISAANNPQAATAREVIAQDMTPEQIVEGQKLSRNWKSVAVTEQHPPEDTDSITQVKPQPVDASAEFRRGYKEGYKKADPYGTSPTPPLAEFGHKTYEDGFGRGYAQAILDSARR